MCIEREKNRAENQSDGGGREKKVVSWVNGQGSYETERGKQQTEGFKHLLCDMIDTMIRVASVVQKHVHKDLTFIQL